MERAPASRLGIVAIDGAGNRREWHFGELIARSAGLSGAMAARGVERGDAVMTLIGSRIEWVLAMLACFRMGAVAMPCNPQLRRKDLELEDRGGDPEALHRRGGAARRAARRACPAMTLTEVARHSTRTCPRRRPPTSRTSSHDDPAVIIFTSGTTGDPARCRLSAALPASVSACRPSTGSEPANGELAWCTAAPGWSKSTRNVFIAPWLQGAAALLHDARFDPIRAPGDHRAGESQRPLPGADRVPNPRQASRAAPGSVAATNGLGRRAAQPGGDQAVPGAAGDRHRRRLRPDRDRRDQRDAPRRGRPGPRRLDGSAATRGRDARGRRRAPGAAGDRAQLLQPLPGGGPLRRRVVADR